MGPGVQSTRAFLSRRVKTVGRPSPATIGFCGDHEGSLVENFRDDSAPHTLPYNRRLTVAKLYDSRSEKLGAVGVKLACSRRSGVIRGYG